jgi:hypothetical protein
MTIAPTIFPSEVNLDADELRLLHEYRTARHRLNETLDLLNRVLDMRERLGRFGLDGDTLYNLIEESTDNYRTLCRLRLRRSRQRAIRSRLAAKQGAS